MTKKVEITRVVGGVGGTYDSETGEFNMGIDISIYGVPGILGGWNPDELGSSLKLWLKPESLGAADSAISQWDDSSGQNNHAAQESAGSKPTVQASTVGSYSGALFDGDDDLLTLTSEIKFSGAAELFVVVDKEASGSTNIPIGGGVSGNDYTGFGGSAELLFRTSDVGSTTVTPNSTFDTGNFLIRVARDASDNLVCESAGVDKTTGSPSNAGSWDIGTIGSRTGGTSPFGGSVVELVVVDGTLSSDDLASMYSYFDAKYPTLGVS